MAIEVSVTRRYSGNPEKPTGSDYIYQSKATSVSGGVTIEQVQELLKSKKSLHGFESNTNNVLSFTDGTSTFYVSGSQYGVWYKGTRYAKDTESIVFSTDTSESFWYVYFDAELTLQATTEKWDAFHDIPIATVDWSGTGGTITDHRRSAFTEDDDLLAALEAMQNQQTYGLSSSYIFCEDVMIAGTPPWHELERQSDGGTVGEHMATTTSYTELDRYTTAELSTTNIPEGVWQFSIFAKVVSATGIQTGQIKAEIYRLNSAGVIQGSALGSAESLPFTNSQVTSIPISIYTSHLTGWDVTDRIGIILYGKKGVGVAATVTFYHNRSLGYVSEVETPLSLLHNMLEGLNDGDFKHLTAAQYNALKGGTTGQVLAKKTNTDFDFEFVDVTATGGGAGVPVEVSFENATSVTIEHNFGCIPHITVTEDNETDTEEFIPLRIVHNSKIPSEIITTTIYFRYATTGTASASAGSGEIGPEGPPGRNGSAQIEFFTDATYCTIAHGWNTAPLFMCVEVIEGSLKGSVFYPDKVEHNNEDPTLCTETTITWATIKSGYVVTTYGTVSQQIHVGPNPPTDTTMLWLDTN